jgi:hypothetical protein
MPVSLTVEQVRRLRMHAQLLDKPLREVAGVVKTLCGLQAQEPEAAALGVRARSTGLVLADVEKARLEQRTVVRTWGWRYTLHLLEAEDFGWWLPLFGPVNIQGSRSRRAELGLDAETGEQGSKLVRQVLAEHGPLTRASLVSKLSQRGLSLGGQAVPHLLGYTASQGHLCLGPDSGSEPTYVLVEDWLPTRPAVNLSGEAAYRELVLRYLSAYGPADQDDMLRWSGLPARELKAAWKACASRLVEVDYAGRRLWLLPGKLEELEEKAQPVVKLLPRYDNFLLGYLNRDALLSPEFSRRINAGGGIVHPLLVADGQVAGTWKSKIQGGRFQITPELFEGLASEFEKCLPAEVADLGRFLGLASSG